MPHWLIKSAIHHVIALLPGSQKWNEWFQVHVSKSLDLSRGEFQQKLECCRHCMEDFLQVRQGNPGNFTALELGTGWYPVVPVGLYLCGAEEVWTFDIDPLLRRERLKKVFNYFCDNGARGSLQTILPWLRKERLERLCGLMKEDGADSAEALLAKLNIHFEVRDAQNTGLKPRSIDLFFSYSVLEYIPPGVLAGIFSEFRRLSRANAVMAHHIDLFDQFCRFDSSITPLNFLKYSDPQWKWLRSPLTPANRLRISDYRALIAQAGFEVFREVDDSRPAEELAKIRLAPEFQDRSREDLLVASAWVAAKASGAPNNVTP
jgi:hypothetical protein